MTAQITSDSTILHFSAEELQEKNLSAEALTRSQALSLVHDFFEISGQTMPPHPEIEVFFTCDGILLFLHSLYLPAPQCLVPQRISSYHH